MSQCVEVVALLLASLDSGYFASQGQLLGNYIIIFVHDHTSTGFKQAAGYLKLLRRCVGCVTETAIRHIYIDAVAKFL